jgi:hypothetical protein
VRTIEEMMLIIGIHLKDGMIIKETIIVEVSDFVIIDWIMEMMVIIILIDIITDLKNKTSTDQETTMFLIFYSRVKNLKIF